MKSVKFKSVNFSNKKKDFLLSAYYVKVLKLLHISGFSFLKMRYRQTETTAVDGWCRTTPERRQSCPSTQGTVSRGVPIRGSVA